MRRPEFAHTLTGSNISFGSEMGQIITYACTHERKAAAIPETTVA